MRPAPRARFLKPDYDSNEWQKVDDILDVWFDSGSTHAFVLEDPEHFPSLAGIKRKRDGGADTVMYLEGSDQHRGWFQSSLLESCGTRGRAPFDVVLTHGFVLDEDGRKMSKSLGNVTAPQDVIKQSGADILRMWVCASDYADDLRIGPEILKTTVDTYRKLRNTIRWMLGSLAHFREEDRIALGEMPELERLMLHRLTELDRHGAPGLCRFRLQAHLRRAQRLHDDRSLGVLLRHPQGRALLRSDLVDDAQGLPDRARPSVSRHGHVARADAAVHRRGGMARALSRPRTAPCISNCFPELPASWRDDALAEKWRKVRNVRRVVTGAIEIERAQKRIGSSLEAAPVVYVSDPDLFATLVDIDLAEVAITSAATLVQGDGPPTAFRLDDVKAVAVEVRLAEGTKCARSWKILPSVGSDPAYPDVSPRDAQALREWDALRKAAE